MVAGMMAVGLSGVYLTIKHIREEAEEDRLEAEREHAGEPSAAPEEEE